MKRLDRVLLLAGLFACPLLGGETSEPWCRVLGEVASAEVVAVPIPPALYAAADGGAPLAARLRVRDADGRQVPYAIRRRQTHATCPETVWTSLRLVSVCETNGTLRIEAAWPEGLNPSELARVRVRTPLADFEQNVEVQIAGRRVAAGTVCDYGRYANYRRNEIVLTERPVVAGPLVFTFARPVSQVENAEFERMIRTQGKERVTEIRRKVKDQPFRVDGLEVQKRVYRTVLNPATYSECAVTASRTREGKSTVLEFDTHRLPCAGVYLRTKGVNYSRPVRVQCRNGERGWRDLARGEIRVVDLPGAAECRRGVAFRHEVDERRLRVCIDDGDSEPLAFDEPPIALRVADYDVAFIAEPGRFYEIGLLRTGEVPVYDTVVRDYIDRVRDPRRWRLEMSGAGALPILAGGTDSSAAWLTEHAMLLVSLLVFLILGVCCWKMLPQGKNT